MATIGKNSVNKVRDFYYNKKLSVNDIANKLGVSIDAVFYCMRKNRMKRRKQHESNAIRYERSKPSFVLKKISSEKLKTLKVMGVMLYWGEGYKAGGTSVDFANSDKDMIVIFMRFLREICGINEKRLRVYSYFYSNQDIRKNMDYWSKLTRISKKQFSKPYIRNDYNKNKINKMPYGLIHIRYSDKKLLNLIKNWIDEYKNVQNVGRYPSG
ncbi:MAG: hypothetical protein NT136_03720 [Candidatus Moranbacteria bacterium]|nr:hypothetical protein [Candidatus Moranbacteria bacterium]